MQSGRGERFLVDTAAASRPAAWNAALFLGVAVFRMRRDYVGMCGRDGQDYSMTGAASLGAAAGSVAEVESAGWICATDAAGADAVVAISGARGGESDVIGSDTGKAGSVTADELVAVPVVPGEVVAIGD